VNAMPRPSQLWAEASRKKGITQMRRHLSVAAIVALLGLFCACRVQAAEPPRSRFGDNPGHNKILKEALPQEFALFNAARAKGKEGETADAVLNLVSVANRLLVTYDRNPKAPRTEMNLRAEGAYMFAWEKALQTYKTTTDGRVKARIIAAWDSGLKPTPEVQWQIKALFAEWHPAFVTGAFVKLFKSTNDVQTVGAITHVLGEYGQDAEERLLKAKLATISGHTRADEMNSGNINAALERIGYWRAGDPARIGPATFTPPR
jgi:hypothetical protein